MEALIGLLFWATVGFYLYNWYKRKQIATEIESTNTIIKNETDLLMAKLSIKRLHKHFDNVNDQESVNILNETIENLHEAIEKYESSFSIKDYSNNEKEEDIPIREDEDYTLSKDMPSDLPYIFNSIPVVLHYKDSKGTITNRTVDVNKYDGVYLYGYCHTRKGIRTFRVDRIIDISDGSTGEVIKDMNTYFENKYKGTSSYALDKIFNDYYDLLRVLLYVVKADGKYTEKEKVIVRRLIRSLIKNDVVVKDKEVDSLMTDLNIPTINAYKLAVGRLSNQIDSFAFDIIDIAENIIGTDKNIHQNEKFALEYMKKRIAQ